MFTALFLHHVSEVTHQLELGLDSIDFSVVCDLVKGVPHDGDQHVKHCYLGDERGKGEESVAEYGLRAFIIELETYKVAQCHYVLTDQHVCKPESGWALHDLIVSTTIEVKNSQRKAKES